MTKAEREWSLIEALEYCKKKRPSNKSCAGCPYAGFGCGIDAAIEKLKAQTPRVMTKDQIITFNGYVWKEYAGIRAMVAVLIQFGMERIPFEDDYPTSKLNWNGYGKTWRCWSSQPTEEQRKAAAWHEA